MAGPRQECEVEIRVRYAETDAMGYLHHAQYFVYFEIGRTELLRSNGIAYRDMEEMGIFYVVARLSCKYKLPARYDDRLTLITRTERMTPVMVEHSYRILRDGATLTEGASTLVSVGRNGRPLALPEDVYNRLVGVAAPPGGH